MCLILALKRHLSSVRAKENNLFGLWYNAECTKSIIKKNNGRTYQPIRVSYTLNSEYHVMLIKWLSPKNVMVYCNLKKFWFFINRSCIKGTIPFIISLSWQLLEKVTAHGSLWFLFQSYWLGLFSYWSWKFWFSMVLIKVWLHQYSQ